ncbi:MAG TPA: transcription-repair coupling factor [Pantanalinema sp.]
MSNLTELTAFATAFPAFETIRKDLVGGRTLKVGGVTPASAALVASALAAESWLLVAPSADVAKRLQADLVAYGVEALYFPAVEVTPYEGVSPEEELLHARQAVLAKLCEPGPHKVITTPRALAMRLPSPEAWRAATVSLKPGDLLSPHQLTEQLIKLGYRPATTVTDKGEFSRRGGILDVFAPQADAPCRLEFFGDEIDRIQEYELSSQRSTEPREVLSLWPTRELILPTEGWGTAEQLLSGFAEKRVHQLMGGKRLPEAAKLTKKVQSALEQLRTFQYFEGCEYYAPFFGGLGSLIDYLPGGSPVLWLDRKALVSAYAAWVTKIQKRYDEGYQAGDLVPLPTPLHLGWDALEAALKPYAQLDLSPAEDGAAVHLGTHAPLGFGNQFDKLTEALKEAASAGQKVVVASTQPQRVYAILEERGFSANYGGRLPLPSFDFGGVWIVRESLNAGFVWPQSNLMVLSDAELFGWQKRPGARAPKRAPHAGAAIASLSELRAGDYVVHAKHGIGQYLGLKRLEMNNQEREYLLIQYHGDDRLYVPVEQFGLLHRYRGTHEGKPKVNKMGGADWENVKKRVKKGVAALAEDLLKLYAHRAAQPGYAYPEDSVWQAEMEGGFPYSETPDQLRAIAETKADMERGRPMDRLVCGDVGFGKTEVALRAIFKAAMSGKQVALLAPTTLLAHQHYQTLRERFAPYPIKVSLLSRFKSAKEQKETTRGLETGTVDVVVGTHRMLSKDVAFKDLGLLIVDEEHRFGVAHKERLKHLKATVDVLTMSATPIPRTLYLALSGARDMSLITTPPMNRQPVKTTVGPYDPETVRTAILHELERGGQVFVLHNRVDSIYRVAAEIQELVPQARVVVGHGQMNENALEDVMLSFLNHEYDVLVSTTIIESGLDIPNANTMIIDDADRLGLAQLYQIRGRVGRSDVKAYCYCFYRAGKELTPEGRERLDALQQFTALGSGYQIALRDMEIRGVGNILGGEQHGQMITVGYDLYMQLLEEAVAELQGQEVVSDHQQAVIDLSVAAYLPDDWFLEPGQKMDQYKRLAGVASARELELLGSEWRDRFGAPPQPVRNLVRVVGLRLTASELGVAAVRSDAKTIRVQLGLSRSAWADLTLGKPGLARWHWGESELTCGREGLTAEDQISAVEKLLTAIASDAEKVLLEA